MQTPRSVYTLIEARECVCMHYYVQLHKHIHCKANTLDRPVTADKRSGNMGAETCHFDTFHFTSRYIKNSRIQINLVVGYISLLPVLVTKGTHRLLGTASKLMCSEKLA